MPPTLPFFTLGLVVGSQEVVELDKEEDDEGDGDDEVVKGDEREDGVGEVGWLSVVD